MLVHLYVVPISAEGMSTKIAKICTKQIISRYMISLKLPFFVLLVKIVNTTHLIKNYFHMTSFMWRVFRNQPPSSIQRVYRMSMAIYVISIGKPTGRYTAVVGLLYTPSKFTKENEKLQSCWCAKQDCSLSLGQEVLQQQWKLYIGCTFTILNLSQQPRTFPFHSTDSQVTPTIQLLPVLFAKLLALFERWFRGHPGTTLGPSNNKFPGYHWAVTQICISAFCKVHYYHVLSCSKLTPQPYSPYESV